MADLVDDTTRDGDGAPADEAADWQRRVVGRSLKTARQRSIDRGASLIAAAEALLKRSGGDGFTVQDVADEAGQSLRTLYQYFESKDDLLLAVFEEAMRTYARLIADAITGLEDPLERLAGAIIAAAAMADHTHTGLESGLARLRLRLGQVEPELVARSQAPVSNLVVGLIDDAVAAGRIPECSTEQTAFLVTSLNASFVGSRTLGNDVGLELPDPAGLARFCLGGLQADTSPVDGLADRLHFPS
ncbi:MAG: TetR/AcrR family transcriptional regulator [Acidimicrobiales bacterium]|nr:TetR/AcrR family transcriptional regulator [Acidimicrobiales bacterium]